MSLRPEETTNTQAVFDHEFEGFTLSLISHCDNYGIRHEDMAQTVQENLGLGMDAYYMMELKEWNS